MNEELKQYVTVLAALAEVAQSIRLDGFGKWFLIDDEGIVSINSDLMHDAFSPDEITRIVNEEDENGLDTEYAMLDGIRFECKVLNAKMCAEIDAQHEIKEGDPF